MIEIQTAERERKRRERERERERERKLVERLKQERRQREHEERHVQCIEEQRKRTEYERQRKLEKAQEEEKRMRLEKELCLRRHELFNYKFGNKTWLGSFGGLELDDVTQLRIGVFGVTESGKSCLINTCEPTVRQTEKGSAPDGNTGQEGTITLQDYLPELFFRWWILVVSSTTTLTRSWNFKTSCTGRFSLEIT